MKSEYFKKFIYGLAGILFMQTGNAASQLIVFGDSLSDPGNYFQLYGEFEVKPYEAQPVPGSFVPGAPYQIGGGHFTNGETWIEILARDMNRQAGGSPATLVPGKFTNYAVGRSRARALPVGVFNEVNLTSQVDRFLADFDSTAPADALYVIWIGANDVGDALQSGNGDLVTAALQNIYQQTLRLYQSGARDFLLVNIPNFATTPLFLQIAEYAGPAHDAVLAGAQSASLGFNYGQALLMQSMQISLPGIQIRMLDVYSALEDIVANPADYDLEVVDESCLLPDIKGKVFCTRQDSYLYWDSMHPTRVVHEILADTAYQFLNE